MLGWPGDVGASGHSVPLRLAGALHGLVLEGRAPSLAAVYPPNDASDDALWAAVEDSLRRHETRILAWLDRAPQTNEVRRAAAVIAGLWWALGEVGDRPVVLSELGASAGLNLALDRFSVAMDGAVHGPPDAVVALAPEWRGARRPAPRPIAVTGRGAVDLAPLDAAAPQDALRLLAYLWPDQPERLARTRAAIGVAWRRPDAGDAAPWLARRLGAARPGALHVVYTTVAAQYFLETTRAAIADSLAQAGARATAEAPLLHLALEADGRSPGAGLVATLYSGGDPVQRRLARASFHVDWIAWAPEQPETPLYPILRG
jgi:PTH1 family peptidyl-tRNA hydrolase